MKLEGGERLVLRSLLDLQGDSGDYVEDSRLAAATRMFVQDVRDWLETLEGKGFVERSRGTEGFSAYITAKGKQALRLTEFFQGPKPAVPKADSGASHSVATPVADQSIPRQERAAFPRSSEPVRTILVLAANPKDTERLRIDEEVKRIEQGLERSRKRDQFRLVPKWAVTVDDLRRALLDYEPEIVHFSGHGSHHDGLAFEDDAGQAHLISDGALSGLFELCADFVKCVVLNACYSEAQADAIARHIGFVIGMKKAISDDSGVKFSLGFYDALGAGRDYEAAYRFGCIAIDLSGLPGPLTPVLKKKQ